MLRNWQCYAGEQELVLEPKAYGIVARRRDDPDSSNWAGKSALLEAIHFALFGALNKHRKGGVSGWVTEGEASGGVELELSDGTCVRRVREESTRVYVERDGRKWAGDEAQAEIARCVGLSPDDFLSTFYFRQRASAQLVLAKAEDRMDYVRSWFDIEPLERVEAAMRRTLAEKLILLESASMRIATLRDRVRELNADVSSSRAMLSLDQLVKQETHFERVIGLQEAEIAELDVAIGKAAEANKKLADTDRYREIVRRGTELASEVREHDLEALKREERVSSVHVRDAISDFVGADRDLTADKAIARDGFSGVCPVMGAPCPSHDIVDSACRQWQDRVDVAQQRRDDALAARDVVVDRDRVLRQKVVRLEQKTAELDRLRQDAARLVPDGKPLPEAPDISGLLQKQRELRESITASRQDLRGLQGYRKERVRLQQEIEKVSAQLDSAKQDVDVARVAIEIVGKNGAQRRMAERGFAEITHDANVILTESNVELRVDVSWSREGAGLAKNCDKCGHPFSASAKARTCDRCGSSRGANLINRLEIDLSDRSGAAEDLGGIAIQIAVSRYLRRVRGSDWSSLLVDEPFAQCDRSNRRALSRALVGMMSGSEGFEQAFVVSHASDTEVFPGALLVERDGNRSRVRVVS